MRQRLAADIVDVFVYVVVLNLFIEYLPSVVSESFTASLLTAIVLKAVLEVVVAVEHRVKARFRSAPSPGRRAVVGTVFVIVMVGSKFLVLEIVDLLFGDRVSLGGFLSVMLLVITLLVARAAVRRLLAEPRPPGAAPSSAGRAAPPRRVTPANAPGGDTGSDTLAAPRPRSSGDRAPDS